MSKRDVKQKDELQLFNYEQNAVRTIDKDGEIWFVAKDVCDILEIANARDAVSTLDDDERMTIANTDLLELPKYSSGVANTDSSKLRSYTLNMISESGLYTLIFRSNKPEAKAFRRWVTHEVLPSIRKTGKYESPRANCRRAVEAFIRTQVDPDDDINGETKHRVYWVERRTKGIGGANFIEVFDL